MAKNVDKSVVEKLVPYVYATDWNRECLELDIDLNKDIEHLDFADKQNQVFGDLWLESNQLAFGGIEDMGMPNWVFVDCAILSSGAIGFMLPEGEVPDKVYDEIDIPDDYDGWVPVSEYSFCPTVEDDTVSGFSLHSRLEGLGIGTRTKAFGLYAAGARYQTGVTQYTSPALRVHTRFGPLEILNHRPAIHEHSQNSFAYRLHVPPEQLGKIARGEVKKADRVEDVEPDWYFSSRKKEDHARLAELVESDSKVFILSPGCEGQGGNRRIPIQING